MSYDSRIQPVALPHATDPEKEKGRREGEVKPEASIAHEPLRPAFQRTYWGACGCRTVARHYWSPKTDSCVAEKKASPGSARTKCSGSYTLFPVLHPAACLVVSLCSEARISRSRRGDVGVAVRVLSPRWDPVEAVTHVTAIQAQA